MGFGMWDIAELIMSWAALLLLHVGVNKLTPHVGEGWRLRKCGGDTAPKVNSAFGGTSSEPHFVVARQLLYYFRPQF
jgi:hypothetical protein